MFVPKKSMTRALMVFVVIGFLLFAPSSLHEMLEEKTENREKGYRGIIYVWHVVGFKPYTGSLGSTLASVAKSVEKKHSGVFFEVKAMDVNEYELRKKSGERADIVSFPLSIAKTVDPLSLDPACELMLPVSWHGIGKAEDGTIKALPYTASACLLFVNSALLQDLGASLPEGSIDIAALNELCDQTSGLITMKNRKGISTIAGTPEAVQMCSTPVETVDYDVFRKGKAVFAVADLRAASEMRSLEKNGKAFSFAAFPLQYDKQALVQLVSLDAEIDAEKIPFALEYVSMMFGEKAQTDMIKQGLLSPFSALYETVEYAESFPTDARKVFNPAYIPNMYGADR